MESVTNPKPLFMDTATAKPEGFDVTESMSQFRQEVRGHLEKSYSTIPIRKTNLSLKDYVNKYPQSAIVVSKQDANLFPVVVDEAKRFADKHGNGQWRLTSKWLAYVKEHEGEHLGEGLSAGLDVRGIGLVMYRTKKRLLFGGFVGVHDQNLKSDEKLAFLLAPTIPGTSDLSSAFQLIAGSKTQDELNKNLDAVDNAIKNKFPMDIINFVKKVLKS